jgi:ribonuclease P protein subunit POP4
VCDVLPAGRRTGSKRGGVAAVDATAWDRYAPLRKLWAGYIREILNVGHEKRWVGVEEAGAMLVGADFHGAVITVVRSRCVGRVGVQGMVLREARGVLVLVGRRGEVRMVPKEGTVFEVRVVVEDEVDEEARNRGRDLVFEVHGDGVVCRPAERAGKKFKAKMNVNL